MYIEWLISPLSYLTEREFMNKFKKKPLNNDLIALLVTMLLQVIIFHASTCIHAQTKGLDTYTLVSILGFISYTPSNLRFNKNKPQSKTKASGIVLLFQFVLLTTHILLMLVSIHSDSYISCLKLLSKVLPQMISTLDKMYYCMSTSLLTNKKRKRLRKKMRNRN